MCGFAMFVGVNGNEMGGCSIGGHSEMRGGGIGFLDNDLIVVLETALWG